MATTPAPGTNTAPGPGRGRAGRPQRNSYADLMKPGENWDDLADATERRKIKNRLAQRAYRKPFFTAFFRPLFSSFLPTYQSCVGHNRAQHAR
jgi:hypothetical protein